MSALTIYLLPPPPMYFEIAFAIVLEMGNLTIQCKSTCQSTMRVQVHKFQVVSNAVQIDFVLSNTLIRLYQIKRFRRI